MQGKRIEVRPRYFCAHFSFALGTFIFLYMTKNIKKVKWRYL